MNHSRKSGFTLFELLITIAIIAVLTGIIAPISISLVRKSHEAACASNLRNIGVGINGYLQDNNNRLPVLALGRENKSSDVPVLETVIFEYVESADVFHCPSDSEEFKKTGSSYNWNVTQNGRHISKLSFLGIEDRPEIVPLVSDKEAWHSGETNFLYADYSSSTDERFATRRGN
jgi:prepilin-type N-terminal cleavage/methylation domain-containing protein